MRHVFIASSIYLTVALQTSAIVGELPPNCRPFLPAMMLVAIGLWSEGATAIVWSALLGLLLDGLSPERLGVQMSLAAAVGWLLQTLPANSRARGLIPVLVAVFSATLVWRAVSPFAYSTMSGRTIEPLSVLTLAVVEASLTAGVTGVLVYGERLLLGRPADSGSSSKSHWSMLTE